MSVSPLSRRSAIVAALALPATIAVARDAFAQSGSQVAASDLVRRWINDVVRPQKAQLSELAHPDLVMELHGAGANEDGKPRVLNGLPAVFDWFERVKAQHVAPVSVRIDKEVAQGDTVALLGENVWTLQGQQRVQTIAAFYTIKDGKIAHIARFTDRIGRTQA